MTEHIREWLPNDAFTKELVQSALSTLLAEWSERWLLRGHIEVADTRVGKTKVSQPLAVRSEFAEIEVGGRGKRLLLESVLGIDLSGVAISESDRSLLDAVATEAVTDLLAGADEIGRASQSGEHLTVTLALEKREMAFFFLPMDALVLAMKTSMGRQRKVSRALRPRLEALRPMSLGVVASLGKADVALGDLRNLAVGDVVVLDKAVQEPVELHLGGTNRSIVDGRLGRDGSRVTIQF